MSPRTIFIISSAFIVFLALLIHVEYQGRSAMNKAQVMLEQEDLRAAQYLLLQAGRWHHPFSKRRSQAATKLVELGKVWQTNGDFKSAVSAFDDARALFYSTRARPSSPILDEATQGLHESLLAWHLQLKPEADSKAFMDTMEQQSAVEYMPSPIWSVIMALGFLGFVSSAFRFFFHSGKRAWVWAVISLACVPVFLLSLVFMGP